MEIRDNSWHHKFYAIGHGGFGPRETNLCSYFWRTVLGLGIATFMISFALAFLGGIGFMAYMHTAGFFMVLGGLGAILVLAYLNDCMKDREPGLLRAYLRAKKEKVCPLVEIV